MTHSRYSELKHAGDASTATMMVIQPFRVIFGQVGEYAEDVGNLCVVGTHSNGIVAPFPRFNAEHYSYATCVVEDDNMVRHTLPCMVEMGDVVFH
jgi:hypothetical protein